MSDLPVPVIVVTAQQDDVEHVNRILRDAGHPVRCRWINDLEVLSGELDAREPHLILLFADRTEATVGAVAKTRSQWAPMVPLVVVSNNADETTMTEAMEEGAQDLVSVNQRQRILAVAEREMRSYRLEHALNDTLNSATQYKRQLRAFMAGSVDAIADVQEGIIVEANQAWVDLFGYADPADAHIPLMDCVECGNHPALKGALIACGKGQWDGNELKVRAVRADQSAVPIEFHLEPSIYDGEPAVKLSVRQKNEPPQQPEELVARAVHVDPPTGLLNRQRFLQLLTDRLDEKPQDGARALTVIRIDKFRELQNELGPIASEEILIQVAGLLRGMTNEKDISGRLGGTIFAVVLERGTLRDIQAWAEHAVSRISGNIFEIANRSVSATCTIGLAEIGQGTEVVEDIVRKAEAANQLGRERGGNQVVLEETSDESTRIKRFDSLWVHQIKSALVDNRFRLAHLPIAKLSGGGGKIYDTVLRMIDQQGDEVRASEFMASAQRNNLSRPIDRWVIGSSIVYCAHQHCDLLFIKLSRNSINDDSLIDWVCTQVREQKVKPQQFCFQISETDAMQNLKRVHSVAERLRKAGFSFAIEHFGLGRDPMRILNQMPMNFVKIDGSLMQTVAVDPAQQDRVRAFVHAAAKRQIGTIAERVEDANTMAVLFQLGIDYMQGHYVHEPEVVLEEQA
jgi:diguanylate cyclase (GGDEF)-like protein